MINKKQKKVVLEIINSEKFDKETFERYAKQRWIFDYEEDSIYYIIITLQKQYMDLDIENILANNDKEEIIDFLNRLIRSELDYNNGIKQNESITLEELEEFRKLAAETGNISELELSITAPLLTTRTFMDLCRVVYDATFDWKYPSDISTAFLFCEARMFSYEHEYLHGIFGCDWDSPEEFALNFITSYHNEELKFGGPTFAIYKMESISGNDCDSLSKPFNHWIGFISTHFYDAKKLCEAIKMYIALREKNYPVYFRDYDGAYLECEKFLRLQEERNNR